MNKNMTTRCQFKLDVELERKIKRYAHFCELNVSEFVRVAVKEKIDRTIREQRQTP